MPENIQPTDCTALEYELLVASRTRYVNPLNPIGRQINWRDRPSSAMVYKDAARMPLFDGVSDKILECGISGTLADAEDHPTKRLKALSDLLLLSAGLLKRRLSISWATDGNAVSTHRRSRLLRGTASGGGLYPVDIHALVLPGIGLQEGIYDYDATHHALALLRPGSFDSEIEASLEYRLTPDVLLVLGVHFWRSSCKYQNFAYKVCSQDVGALLASIEQLAHSLGWKLQIIYWFKDVPLAKLLGYDLNCGGPFAVLALESGHRNDSTTLDKKIAPERCDEVNTPLPSLFERVTQRTPDLVVNLHRRTFLVEVIRPQSPELDDLVMHSSVVPSAPVRGNLVTMFRQRETSWGSMRLLPALQENTVLSLLSFALRGVHYQTDVFGHVHGLPFIRIAVIAKNVESVLPGSYEYGAETGQLRFVETVDWEAWRSVCFQPKYNLDQTPLVLVVIGKLDAFTFLGERGIRVLNAEVGMFAQRTYLAAAALGIACGCSLGFDAQITSRLIAVDKEVEVPMMLVFVGNQARQAVGYDFRLA